MPEDFVNRMISSPTLSRRVNQVLPADQDIPAEEQEIVARHIEAVIELLRQPVTFSRLLSEVGLPDTGLNGRAVSRILFQLGYVSDGPDGQEVWQLRPDV
jgi:hypothetical protein